VKEWLSREGCWIRPIYLPSYAPNLNMIERLCLFMKFWRAFNDFFDNIGPVEGRTRTLADTQVPRAPASGIPWAFRFNKSTNLG
jgi:hypothetical protein